MAAYGVDCVIEALKRPWPRSWPTPATTRWRRSRRSWRGHSAGGAIAVDCDTGELADMLELGVVDAAPVKLYALQAAGEIAAAILRINTVIRKRDEGPEEAVNGER